MFLTFPIWNLKRLFSIDKLHANIFEPDYIFLSFLREKF